jgi:hypothetical protein
MLIVPSLQGRDEAPSAVADAVTGAPADPW